MSSSRKVLKPVKKIKRVVDEKDVIFRVKVCEYTKSGKPPTMWWGVEITRNGKRIDSGGKVDRPSVAWDSAHVYEQNIRDGNHDRMAR